MGIYIFILSFLYTREYKKLPSPTDRAISRTIRSCFFGWLTKMPATSRRKAFGQKYHFVLLPIPSIFMPFE